MRLGGLKYVSPLRYMGTKIIADAFHATLFSRSMPRTNIPCLDLTRHQVADNRAAMREIARSQRACAALERPKHELRPLPPRPKPQPAYEYPPLRPAKLDTAWGYSPPQRDPNRPAAVKRNGGLRGSTATKWR